VRPFLKALREGLRLAESAESAKYGFKPGDAEHLRRWLADKRAPTIFAKLTKRHKLTQKGIVQHIKSVLDYRQLAEETDRLNATFAELKKDGPRLAKKERRRATKVFADGGVPQGALDDYLDYVDEMASRPSKGLDPLFAVRSDRAGSRKRTIFCRILSDLIHFYLGRWHDAEVAALCEIAFDCDVTIETVKDARKGMRSSKPRSP
jgi:hypothetical protein